MPFSFPGVGSGALRQAWSGQMDRFRFGKYATNLDEVLAFRLCDQRLELWGGEGVHKTSLGYDEQ